MHSHGADAASKIFPQIVLILVVMEDALAHIKNKDMEKLKMVLILVVMEDALAHVQRYATRNLKVQS